MEFGEKGFIQIVRRACLREEVADRNLERMCKSGQVMGVDPALAKLVL